ncbi:MAG TPA: hypothetical protein VI816_01535, partial [Candidatus Bathyarchaeia archaeon]|nr:hypothetical protein [Candidatus Bathyarchaeia archaeon]
LRIFASDHERYGIMAAAYALALDAFLSGPIGITIVGSRKRKAFESFRLQALRTYSAGRSILYLDPSGDSGRMKKLGYDATGSTTAYVCVGKVCGPPLKDPSQIESSVTSLLRPSTPAIGT